MTLIIALLCFVLLFSIYTFLNFFFFFAVVVSFQGNSNSGRLQVGQLTDDGIAWVDYYVFDAPAVGTYTWSMSRETYLFGGSPIQYLPDTQYCVRVAPQVIDPTYGKYACVYFLLR